MGAPHFVMKHWDPMIGIDIHIANFPPPAPPVPGTPYPTLMFVSGMYIFFKPNWKHISLYGTTVQKGTDIGSLIPHIPGPPSITLPVEIATSASKSHFGSAAYKAQGNMVCLDLLVSTNPNLNCGTPCPTPTGFVITFTTHAGGMSWGDVFAGLGSMLADWALQTVLNALGNLFGEAFGKLLSKVLGPLAGRAVTLIARAAGKKFPNALGVLAETAVEAGLKKYGGTILAFLFGGPMGGDIGTFGGYGTDENGNAVTPGSMFASGEETAWEHMGRAFGNYLDGDPDAPNPPPTVNPPVAGPKPVIPNVTNNSPFQ